MIRVEEALNHILNSVSPLDLEKTDILNALGRVIGEDIYAGRNIPPKDNSAMDGYALKSEDIKGASADAPAIVETIEDIPAGYLSQKTIGPGQAARIMTGAYVPEGADTVVKVEDTDRDGNRVRIFVESPRGENIRYSGEDVKVGDLVISKGKTVGPAEVGMLASLGRSFIKVYQKPLVAIIATGDEIADIDEDISEGKIISSNSYSLHAQIRECGAVALQTGIAKDRKENLIAAFRATLRADVIISSGGVSVGDYDYVKDVMAEMGTNIEFWQVAQRPGKPLAFGTMEGKLVFGLPGNPVSSMITFEEYVRPALLKMMGREEIFRRTIKATLTEDIKKKGGLKHFIRALVEKDGEKFTVSTTGEQGSGILKSMVLANGIIVLPEDMTLVKKGEEVSVQLIDDSFEKSSKPEYLTF
ncbi:MAG: molybdopterin molybdotransferase MoeA [Deltaproteobacteria bacterium]|nr:molybdopterin molybdotransferase MoeA [Deltaproteobacteria bacterium]